MNRRGSSVPIAILAIIALGLVLFAGYSFLTVFGGFGKSSGEFSELMSRAELNELYVKSNVISVAKEVFSKNTNESKLKDEFKAAFDKRNISKFEGVDNIYGKVRNGDFTIEIRNARYYFEMNDTFISVEVGYNRIKRSFDITYSEIAKKSDKLKPSECSVHASGLAIGAKTENEMSLVFKTDDFSDIIGVGEYPEAGKTFLHAGYASSKLLNTLDSIAAKKGTRVTLYSQKNFKGKVLFEMTGPFILYSKESMETLGEYINSNWPEPYESDYPKDKRLLADFDMHSFAIAQVDTATDGTDINENMFSSYGGGSLKVECAE